MLSQIMWKLKGNRNILDLATPMVHHSGPNHNKSNIMMRALLILMILVLTRDHITQVIFHLNKHYYHVLVMDWIYHFLEKLHNYNSAHAQGMGDIIYASIVSRSHCADNNFGIAMENTPKPVSLKTSNIV